MRFAAYKQMITAVAVTLPMLTGTASAQTPASCYRSLLSSPLTLSAYVETISGAMVTVNGVDTLQPTAPFQWNWGDGSPIQSSGFPFQHTYASSSQNYIIQITSTENNGSSEQIAFPVFFVTPSITPNSLSGVSFQIPAQTVQFQTHESGFPVPDDFTYFGGSAFPVYSSSDVAYILDAISSIDYGFVNQNSFLQNGVFSMDMLELTNTNAGESDWFTTPMAVAYNLNVVDPSTGSTPLWYILFNETGKDTTLNTPNSLPYGVYISVPGNANEIYSETLGDIFAYASGCQLVSNATTYGLGSDTTADIKYQLIEGASLLQSVYNTYVADGAPFSSWNPGTGTDPTIGTFTTLAWVFIEEAETTGQGYQVPLTRMMTLLQLFTPSMAAAYGYGQGTDSQAAETFRSTLMVTAISYAFNEDLRSEFEALNFPIDNATYEALYQLASGTPLTPAVTVAPSSSSITTAQPLTVSVAVSGSTAWLPTPTGSVTLTGGGYTSAAATLSGGTATISIPAGSLATGSDTLTVTYTPDSSSSSTYNSATGSAPVTVTTPAKVTPTVGVTPSSSSITTTQALSVTVVVSGGSSNPTPTGSVTLTGGGYTSAATTLSGGAATISVSAGSLSVGIDTFTADYAPDSASTAVYNSASGTAVVTVTQAEAPAQYTEKVIYTFTGGNDGGQPYAGVISDANGNLYGTTSIGGASGKGVVFELIPSASEIGSWTETSLYSFTGGNDGGQPYAGVILDAKGNLYGTTISGGALGNGVVFELSPPSSGSGSWTEKVLYSFKGGTDGEGPSASVVFDGGGNLYGTTSGGGSSGNGTVFEVSQASNGGTGWAEKVLYSFTGESDGANPVAGVVLDKSGNLYGTTSNGGAASASCAGECGSVFELASQSNGGWLENTLYSFQGNSDGLNPLGGVIFDGSGNLYGTTSGFFPIVGGNVFELSPSSNSAWTETPIYTFQGVLANGWTPEAGLVFDQSGNLYGTTAFGGSSAGSENCIGNGTMGVPNGCGTVLQLSSNFTDVWTERVIYSFQGNADGAYPKADLILDSQGNLYSTATSGGNLSGCDQQGCGVVFELSPIPSGTVPTAITLTLSPSSVTAGSPGPVMATATIAPASGSGTPTGTASFFNGSTQIGATALSIGVATLNYNPSSLAAGTYSITASYSGDSTFAGSTSSAQTLIITAPPPTPTYSMSATSVSVSPGVSGTSTVTVTSSNGYSGIVSLSCTITSSPSGAVDMPTCSSTQTVTLSSGTTNGTATVTVNTTAASSVAVVRPELRERQGWGEAGGGALLALLLFLGTPTRLRKWRSILGIFALTALFGLVAACGGGGGSGGGGSTQQTNPGTTPGSYTITVTGTGNDAAKTTATTTFALTVS